MTLSSLFMDTVKVEAGIMPTRPSPSRRNCTCELKEQFEFAAFALRQFAERARRDGASLLVLSEFYLNSGRLKLIAGELGITVLSLRDYAAQQGLRLADLHWDHDWHWNAIGHRHAAAALLEHLKENQDVCAGAAWAS